MAVGMRIAPDEHEVELREWLAVSWNEPDCRVATDVETESKSSTAVSEENILGYRRMFDDRQGRKEGHTLKKNVVEAKAEARNDKITAFWKMTRMGRRGRHLVETARQSLSAWRGCFERVPCSFPLNVVRTGESAENPRRSRRWRFSHGDPVWEAVSCGSQQRVVG
jgi:hypothetical protein